jgi:restriction system protein
MSENEYLPSSRELMPPTIDALRKLGGSGRVGEINNEVIQSQGFSDEQLAIRSKKNVGLSEIYRLLGWSRTLLKRDGLIRNSAWGVWTMCDQDFGLSESDIHSHHGDLQIRESRSLLTDPDSRTMQKINNSFIEDSCLEASWRQTLLERLQVMHPSAFERLAQQLLREAGFQSVQVTGRSGDGGIDGIGVYQISLVPFRIFFQCKRYKGTVSPSEVREFRGAMSGRGEKGLLITTGSFTKSAQDEAVRDGAPTVELVDGEQLCDLLKKYSLGVQTVTRNFDDVTVDEELFSRI